MSNRWLGWKLGRRCHRLFQLFWKGPTTQSTSLWRAYQLDGSLVSYLSIKIHRII
jgi:hypothetical protein